MNLKLILSLRKLKGNVTLYLALSALAEEDSTICGVCEPDWEVIVQLLGAATYRQSQN